MKLQIKNINNNGLISALSQNLALVKRTGIRGKSSVQVYHLGCKKEGRGYATFDLTAGELNPLLETLPNCNSVILDDGKRISIKQYKASVNEQ